MVRKKVLIRKRDNKIIDAGLVESPKTPTDAEVSQEFDDAKKIAGSGRSLLEQKLKEHHSSTPDLTARDIDASWERADIGDETVGGDNMTPDQSIVDYIGEAVGLTHDDEEPLRASVDEKTDRKNGTRRFRPHEEGSGDLETRHENTRNDLTEWE
jgi:hypothetical protein